MKVERKELPPVQAQKQTHKGAVAGDKVIFSPHNPINQKADGYLWTVGITPNKIYTINDDLKFTNDNGVEGFAGTDKCYIGEFDIIEKAPRIDPVQPFVPVHLILETLEDVKRIAELLGNIGNGPDGEGESWGELREICGDEYERYSYNITKN